MVSWPEAVRDQSAELRVQWVTGLLERGKSVCESLLKTGQLQCVCVCVCVCVRVRVRVRVHVRVCVELADTSDVCILFLSIRHLHYVAEISTERRSYLMRECNSMECSSGENCDNARGIWPLRGLGQLA